MFSNNETISITPNSKQYNISNATLKNWKKLNTKLEGRLTTRANKMYSKKRILPIEYFSNTENIPYIQNVLDYIDENKIGIINAMLSLCINLLKKANIYNKPHVTKTLNEYENITIIDILTQIVLPDNEFDILGLIYQSFLQEGKKNTIGSYYTPQTIVQNMTKNFILLNGESFFDPCCGSGAFLLSVTANNPNQLFGIDNDQIAVLISKINLLLKYKNFEFIPQIYCLDFLKEFNLTSYYKTFIGKKFDYIATNPPWGAIDNYNFKHIIQSKETFSLFFTKGYKYLKHTGLIRFLFPEAILNVKVHKDIRKFILESAGLISITKYDDMFSGVTTKYVDILCGYGANKEYFTLWTNNTKQEIDIKRIYETENLIFNFLSNIDISIIQTVKQKGYYSLKKSSWGLGIVTGDNKNKLSSEYLCGLEPIYTGKEIQPYILKPAKNYIKYDRNSLQQVAKDEIYRSPEKLIYKFISKKLIFAYDNKKSLFLNSANILIPSIPSMSIKCVMAFLNSSLFQYMYIKLFGEVKILKGNLMELPFPKITEEENNRLTTLVENVLQGDKTKIDEIENVIYSIYELNYRQIAYIKEIINGKTH